VAPAITEEQPAGRRDRRWRSGGWRRPVARPRRSAPPPLVQVDVVGSQPGEGLLHGELDVVPAALGSGGRTVAHVHGLVAELGGEHDLNLPAQLLSAGLSVLVLAAHDGQLTDHWLRNYPLRQTCPTGDRGGHPPPPAAGTRTVHAQSSSVHAQQPVRRSSGQHHDKNANWRSVTDISPLYDGRIADMESHLRYHKTTASGRRNCVPCEPNRTA